MEFSEMHELKMCKDSNDIVVKIKQTDRYSKKVVLFEDSNVCLCKLFTANNIILGYMLSYKDSPRVFLRPISSFIFYSPVEEIEKEKKLKIIFDDKLIRMMSTKSEEKYNDYAFLLKQRGKSLKEMDTLSEENDQG